MKMAITILTIIAISVILIYFGITTYIHIQESIIQYAQIRVSRINIGYEIMRQSTITEIIGYDGKTEFKFWGDQSRLFTVGRDYVIYFHTSYGIFGPANTLINATELKEP